MNRRNLIVWGSLLEFALILCYVLWLYFSGHRENVGFTFTSIALGLGFALVLLVCNAVLLRKVARDGEGQLHEFMSGVIVPLAKELDTPSSLYISICAGIGEELFFRGCLQNEFGIILSSVAFALVHFGPAAIQYRRVVFLYFGFSLGFAGLYVFTQSLVAPIVAHIIYDFFALELIRRGKLFDS